MPKWIEWPLGQGTIWAHSRSRFAEFVRGAFQSNYKSVSSTTNTRKRQGLYKEKRAELVQLLSTGNFQASLTSNLWTSQKTYAYCCVTFTRKGHIGNYINVLGRLTIHIQTNHKMVVWKSWYRRLTLALGTKNFPSLWINHRNNVVARNMVAQMWPVCNGPFFHICCVCDVISLCLQDSLKDFHDSVKL